MKVAIMQPYFLPYIGYWQLMNHVDVFIIYDDIEYTKKGWINRNRFLLNGKAETFTLPLKKDSDYLDIYQRRLSETFDVDKVKLLRRLEGAYRNAPHYREGRALLLDVFNSAEKNLFQFILQSIEIIRSRLNINSKIIVSSKLGISRDFKSQDRVIASCKKIGCTDYINPIGGIKIYNSESFTTEGIRLHFQKVRPLPYRQFNAEFVPDLSIIDMIMFAGTRGVIENISRMDLVEGVKE